MSGTKMKIEQSNNEASPSIIRFIHNTANTLTIILTALRACGVIQWKWYWVISPLLAYWGAAALLITLATLYVMFSRGQDDDDHKTES